MESGARCCSGSDRASGGFPQTGGAALEKKFREKIANITSLLEKITPYEKERVEKVKERITDALEKTLSVDYDKNRLEQELIYYIEKLDVNEEKQRLSNHLKYLSVRWKAATDKARNWDLSLRKWDVKSIRWAASPIMPKCRKSWFR
ncbi:hypothetical protein BFINE_55500 [Bacteroides finegoldii DSM 17565]|nr:hypothetical protein BFINE_55500 [Bacteroides finegoldii DSM 17565]